MPTNANAEDRVYSLMNEAATNLLQAGIALIGAIRAPTETAQHTYADIIESLEIHLEDLRSLQR